MWPDDDIENSLFQNLYYNFLHQIYPKHDFVKLTFSCFWFKMNVTQIMASFVHAPIFSQGMIILNKLK